eukprot:gene6634-9108_t
MSVKQLTTKEELSSLQTTLTKNILFFWASWHEPSRIGGQLHGICEALTSKYPNIKFYLVEAEVATDISIAFNISVVPTFVAIIGNKVIDRLEGVNPSELSNMTKKLNDEVNNITSTTAADGDSNNSAGPSHTSINDRLVELINTAPVMLFMKGSPSQPKCGFSRKTVEILKNNEIPFASFDILTDEEVRSSLKTFSDWPTYPQLYVKGVLIGGLDIITEMQENGNLNEQLGIDSILMALTPPTVPTIEQRLQSLINQSQVVLFMKGSPNNPKCGFSQNIVNILNKSNINFTHFDILTDEEVRSSLKKYSDWPTYPQLYVKGVLIGGLDIVKEMQENGDLKEQLEV